MVDVIQAWLYRLFEEYKLVRRLGIVGLYTLIAVVSLFLFFHPAMITTPVAAAYGTLCGLLGVMFKFYTDSRDRDKK